MTSNARPLYHNKYDHSQLYKFDDTTGWTASGGTGTTELEESEYRTGTAALKLTWASGGDYQLTRTVDWNLSDALYLALRVHLGAGTVGARLYLSNDSGFTNYYWTDLTNAGYTKLRAGWQMIMLDKANWTAVGSPSWSTQFTRMRIAVTSTRTAAVTFDSLLQNYRQRPVVIITADGQWADWVAGGAMEGPLSDAGLVMNMHVETDNFGLGGRMSEAEVLALGAAGHELCVYAKVSADLSALSYDQVKTSLSAPIDWLEANGLDVGAKHMSWPLGLWSVDSIRAAEDLGIVTGRTIEEWFINPFEPNPSPSGYYKLPCFNSSTVNLANMTTYMTNALRYGFHCSLLVHNIQGSFSEANWQTLCATLGGWKKEGRIDVFTWSQWYSRLKQPTMPLR